MVAEEGWCYLRIMVRTGSGLQDVLWEPSVRCQLWDMAKKSRVGFDVKGIAPAFCPADHFEPHSPLSVGR